MAKKHKHEEHVNHERWLVSYADFITLLFAFFVILYALSEVDKNKLKKLSNSVQFAFSYVGTGGTQTQGKQADTYRPNVIGQSWPQGRRDSDPGPFESLNGIVQFLDASISQWFLRNERENVEVFEHERGVVLRLPAERLFGRRSDRLRHDRTRFIEEFGAAVGRFNVGCRIRLHLDLSRGSDLVSAHDLGSRRVHAIVAAVRRPGMEYRTQLSTEIVVRENTEEWDFTGAEPNRSVFEFYMSP